MTELSNTTAQTLTPGQSITFDVVVLKTGDAENFRYGTSSVKMKTNGIYETSYSANVSTATAGDTSTLAIQLGGQTLPETTGIATSGTANEVQNVSNGTYVKNDCCDFDRLTVTNIGTTTITVAANSRFSVKRVG